MKRWVALGLVLLAACPTVAQADTPKLLQGLVARTSGALVAVRYTIQMETGKRQVMGQGICIEASGVFLTTALDPRLDVDMLKEFELIPPGVDPKPIKAKLLSVDAWTGLGFVQATEPRKWQVVEFSKSSNVKIGQQIASVGLLMGDPSRPVYVGTAYASTRLRVPGELIYVTAGRLTGACSPVFTTDGRAVGIVGRQLFLGYQTPSRRGLVPIQLRSQQESAFFTPVEEFVHALTKIPNDGQVGRLPWLGVNKFVAVTKDLADILKLTQPAVKVDDVIPDQPAAKAGLSNRDIIIEVSGRPLERLATPDLTVRNFVRQLMRMPVGTKLALTVLSGREKKTVTATLGVMPMRPSEAKRYFNRALGLLVREKVMLDEYLDKTPTADVPGLVVLGMAQGSPCVAAGMKTNDVITNVNNQPVKTVEIFRQLVERSLATSATAPINFLVRRGAQALVITVKPAG
jgi:S1-C subfamily serine protease